jgi:hypothetical protein
MAMMNCITAVLNPMMLFCCQILTHSTDSVKSIWRNHRTVPASRRPKRVERRIYLAYHEWDRYLYQPGLTCTLVIRG